LVQAIERNSLRTVAQALGHNQSRRSWAALLLLRRAGTRCHLNKLDLSPRRLSPYSYQTYSILTHHHAPREKSSRSIKRRCNRIDQQGFTLIELIMVIVILGVLAVFAAPRIFNNADFYARGFHDETLALLRYAQKSAVAQRRTERIGVRFQLFI
jgi:prepilin-type N-terminal cleavage/methylation domain-containing protein